MDKSPKELIIDPPNELRFCGPFTRPVVTVMKLTNPTDQTMLFKIKTTAPKRYCVRPNFGSIPPRMNAQVEICLQPFAYDVNEKNKHKFMVQSMTAPEDTENWMDLWKEAADAGKLVDAKLKCVFELPYISPSNEGSAGSANEANPQAQKKLDASPKPLNEEKLQNLYQSSDNSDSLSAEIRQLREEAGSLRKENIHLKEQLMRLKSSAAVGGLTKSPMDEPYAPMMDKRGIPTFYFAICVAVAILSLLLGKYLL